MHEIGETEEWKRGPCLYREVSRLRADGNEL